MSLDRYGGSRAHPLVGAGSAFRILKRGRRFLLATPDGNGFWLKACYGVDITDGGEAFVRALHAKHASDATYKAWGYWWPFVAQAVKNLRQWGFNALGEYTSNYAMPVDTNNRGRGNSERMPFIALTNAANYGKQRYGVKDLMFGVDEAVTPNLWRVEGFPDVFDPAFARAVDELTWGGPLPWLLGSSTDDRDYIFGFGPSRALGGWHNHLGWQAAATRPTQASNHRIWVGNKPGVTYTDTTVHTKLALRDRLRAKYRTLDQLNGAWGASYTTWRCGCGPPRWTTWACPPRFRVPSRSGPAAPAWRPTSTPPAWRGGVRTCRRCPSSTPTTRDGSGSGCEARCWRSSSPTGASSSPAPPRWTCPPTGRGRRCRRSTARRRASTWSSRSSRRWRRSAGGRAARCS